MIEQHPLAPFLPLNAKVLLLGSFPPPRQNWKMEFYYPNYNNDMWRIFGLLFFDDAAHFLNLATKTFQEQRLRDFLQRKGVAIHDVAAQVKRQTGNASDLFLDIVQPIDLAAILAQIPQCQTLVTTGEKATQTLLHLLNCQQAIPKIGTAIACEWSQRPLHVYRMPSSSRAYPLALSKKTDFYAQMFKMIGLL